MSTLELTPVAPLLVQVCPLAPEHAFQLELPADWLEHPEMAFPASAFQDPRALHTLARFVSEDGVLEVTVRTRPTYLEGTLSSWLFWLGAVEQLVLGGIAPLQVGALTAASCLASTDTQAGPRWLRLALCEDGQDLFLLTASAPADLSDAMGPVLTQVVGSFALVAPRGQTAAVS